MAKNDVQLDKARQGVANVIWYFNNQELSSRALEKQDPEAFSNWFSRAKHEWDAFATNKGTFSELLTSLVRWFWKRPLRAKSLLQITSAISSRSCRSFS